MMYRFVLLLLLLLLVPSLFSAEDSWYNKIDAKIEAGMHLSSFDGTLTNSASTPTSFMSDLEYTNTTSSYFALELKFDYDYMPNIDISYFNAKQNQDVDLNKTMEVASYVFSGLTSTRIDYKVLNVVLSKQFKKKGRRVGFWRWYFYPGDIEYAIGMSAKVIDWHFEIIDRKVADSQYKFDRVKAFIPLPYLGFKHYYYNLVTYFNVSALSLSEAKSINYQVGIDYKVIDDLYLSLSYMYEDFQAVEKKDSIDFRTTGNKFSFKYMF